MNGRARIRMAVLLRRMTEVSKLVARKAIPPSVANETMPTMRSAMPPSSGRLHAKNARIIVDAEGRRYTTPPKPPNAVSPRPKNRGIPICKASSGRVRHYPPALPP